MDNNGKKELLRQIPLFKFNFTDEMLLQLPFKVKSYSRNEIIFQQGFKNEFLYFVLEGFVRLFMHGEDGNTHLLFLLGPGDFFGEMHLFDEEEEEISATAKKQVVVAAIPKGIFCRLIRYSNLSIEFTTALSKRSYDYFKKIEILTKKKSKERLRLSSKILNGHQLTHEEMGMFCSLTREEVSRTTSLYPITCVRKGPQRKSINQLKEKNLVPV